MKVGKILSPTDTGAAKTHQSGILIPKDQRVLGIFPALDKTVQNPARQVQMWVPELDIFWSARFVFYNTKDLGIGTRSEYRLTQIAGLLRDLRAEPGDRLTFQRNSLGDIELAVEPQLLSGEPDTVTVLKSGWTLEII
ncbi:EcoRII N-terminal effector-binding domain-containing protein [Nocardioides alcanivorans]|uniref:EcoRII N-terminal effector-binding domain-containing protein n=1 Tax=Nocardioides alcanivorans TaxID=2897352 RepID=UPI001F15BC8D|nr:EcoRII N-terminal effector-binding domain-containing protein [Nocardioides alcanivorans]